MKIYINEKQITVNRNTVLYITTIISFVLFITKDLEYNTAFIDEAIYATVGEEILRHSFWENAVSWMGGSYLYPLISALINREFGLKGIRLFSEICILFSGIISGKVGRYLGGRSVETITILLFYFTAVTLNVAQHATYDAPSILLTSLSFYFALVSRSRFKSKEIGFAILSGIAISIAILFKYVAILFLPLIALSLFVREKKLNFQSFTAAFLVIFGIVGIYLAFYYSDVVTYLTGSYSKEPAVILRIISEIFSHVGLFLICTFLSFYFYIAAFRRSGFSVKSILNDEKNRTWLMVLLTVGGLTTISYHLFALNLRSMWKHMVFSVFFLAPLSAYVIFKIHHYVKSQQNQASFFVNISQLIATLITIFTITNLWVNFSKHWRYQRSWPSATKVIDFLQDNMKPESRIFAEGSAVYKYHTFTGFEDPYAWSSTWYLEYKGKGGTEAMKQAISEQTFDYIIFNNYFTPDLNWQLMPDVWGYYDKVLEDNYKVSGEYENPTTVWAKKK